MNNHDFVSFFIEKYTPLIKKLAKRYSIPNRYEDQDIVQYIAERMLHILAIRQDTANIIVDKEKYFKGCLEFYCSEYQRMHGFIFDLPKRPRKNAQDDERDIRSKGFKYLEELDNSEFEKPVFMDHKSDPSHQGSMPTEAWSTLTGLLCPEDAEVVYCIYTRSMTWPETAEYLGVPQSTCWSRRNRALKTLFEYFDGLSGTIQDNVKKVIRGNIETISQLQEAKRPTAE